MIRSLSQSLVVLLSWQLVAMPVALAKHQAKYKIDRAIASKNMKAEAQHQLEEAHGNPEFAGFTLKNAKGDTMTFEQLAEQGASDFFIVSEGGRSYHVSGTVSKDGVKMSIDSSGVLKTHTIELESSQSLTEDAAEFDREIKSMAAEVQKSSPHASIPGKFYDLMIPNSEAAGNNVLARAMSFISFVGFFGLILAWCNHVPEAAEMSRANFAWTALAVMLGAGLGYRLVGGKSDLELKAERKKLLKEAGMTEKEAKGEELE